jgi:hypothetical protein
VAMLWLAGFLQAARLHHIISFCGRLSDWPHLLCCIDFGDANFFWVQI